MATAKSKTAAKAAPAPAPVEEVTEGEIVVGSFVQFLGYGEDVPEADQVLTAGEQYEVVAISEDDGEPGTPEFIQGGNPIVAIPNPDYNPKKKEDPDKNPKNLEVEVFPEEVELVAEEEAEQEAVADEAPAPAPAPAKKTVAAKTPAAKTPAAKTPAAKTPAAKTPAKKTAAKAAPAVTEEAGSEGSADELPELEGEDAEVLALIEGSEDLIGTAQDLEAQVGSAEYRLGGVLYHIKKAKLHLEQKDEGGKPIAAYAENGGFAAFMKDYFNIDYRKAMYLIEIYVNFTQAGIENPGERVAAIGWTKASKISKLLVAEGANPDELLELAETNTVADLSEAIKDQVEVGGTKGEKVERLTLKFRFLAEEGKSIDSILKTVQDQQGLKTLDEALSFIVNDWASTNGAGGVATATSAPKQVAAKAVAKPAVKTAARKAVAAK